MKALLGDLLVLILLAVRQLVTIIQQNVSRYLIKYHISPEGELPMWKWFSIAFIKSLKMPQILSLLAIAGFTIITFPLGVWLNSFSAGVFYPLSGVFGGIIGLFLIPFNLWTLHKTVGEITFNEQTIFGLVLLEIATVIAIVGWYLIYVGNKGG
ncbi:MAG: hypothetical protein KAV41_03520 [Candidatus Pacebacteria bacterium]|nr:hypothetical protein [Candidatus Paceibacterota bacterium]